MAYMDKAKTVEWTTPKTLFDELNKEFHFDLDVASTHENALCENHFTIAENGLKRAWGGYNVFCNPPYSDLRAWIKKAYSEKDNANVIVMLIPARTDTIAFHEYIYGKAEIRFIKGRLKFGNSRVSAPFPSMLVIYRKGENESKQNRA